MAGFDLFWSLVNGPCQGQLGGVLLLAGQGLIFGRGEHAEGDRVFRGREFRVAATASRSWALWRERSEPPREPWRPYPLRGWADGKSARGIRLRFVSGLCGW